MYIWSGCEGRRLLWGRSPSSHQRLRNGAEAPLRCKGAGGYSPRIGPVHGVCTPTPGPGPIQQQLQETEARVFVHSMVHEGHVQQRPPNLHIHRNIIHEVVQELFLMCICVIWTSKSRHRTHEKGDKRLGGRDLILRL